MSRFEWHQDEFSLVDAREPCRIPTEKPRPLVRLWILRLLIRLNVHRRIVEDTGFVDIDLADLLGLEGYADTDAGDVFDRKAIVARIRQMLRVAEMVTVKIRPPAVLTRNIKRLAKLLELSHDECRVLEFAILLHDDSSLDNACDWLGTSISTTDTIRALAKLLALPAKNVAEAVSPQGTLARSGILTIEREHGGTIRGRLNLLSRRFTEQMLTASSDPVELLRGTVGLAPKPELDWSDYTHLHASLDLLRPYLRRVLSERRRGVNIFLHGPPGTGKTQLARLLASGLRCDLFEVSGEDEDGDSINGEQRLHAYCAAQTLLSKRRSLILFDEVEDVFEGGGGRFGHRSIAQTRKAWMNRMLEAASVPTFWLSNSIGSVDPAFIRRFDMVMELSIPPRSQRQRIIERACGDLIGTGSMERIADSSQLAPAVVTRATAVVRTLGRALHVKDRERALEHLISNTLEAQGHARLGRNAPDRLPDTYDLTFLNPDEDIKAVAEGLKESGSGRLCLYGPPGTGKTAFGRWLAQQLDLSLQIRRASDILSPYVGMTERNLADAFKEAEQEGSLLLIDEVDGFLRDRKEAQRPWEVTLVNEMLTQMEAFPGIFIASTNLMEGLDQAALRRFDAKVRFGYLTAQQAVAMLRVNCRELGVGEPSSLEEAAVGRLPNLAPGDFAALARRSRFRPIGSVGALLGLLEAESMLKLGNRRTIGFVQ